MHVLLVLGGLNLYGEMYYSKRSGDYFELAGASEIAFLPPLVLLCLLWLVTCSAEPLSSVHIIVIL